LSSPIHHKLQTPGLEQAINPTSGENMVSYDRTLIAGIPGRMLELGEYLEIQDLARQGVG
jgi:hypothetical protein